MLPSCTSDFISQILLPENKAEMCQQATSGVDKSLFFLRFGLSVAYIFYSPKCQCFQTLCEPPMNTGIFVVLHVSAFILNILYNPAYSIVFRSATPAYARAQINKSSIKLHTSCFVRWNPLFHRHFQEFICLGKKKIPNDRCNLCGLCFHRPSKFPGK